jgi:uncharacterized Rossmann fold enzyme
MEFETWEPVYEAILADFGYDRAGDERARDTLADLLADAPLFDPGRLDVAGDTVAVAGAADCLDTDLPLAREADAVFAASTAADRLRAQGVSVDCMVTDLDKNPGTVQTLAAEGTPVAVHAHGDNIPALRAWIPAVESRALVPTTQAAPTPRVRNDGGFTDGDRAAFLADALGATRLVFPGWNFDDEQVTPEKRRKLAWAERLLAWLERRRGDSFAVLDGRREDIDTSVFDSP